jgi:phage tail sheath protein FI
MPEYLAPGVIVEEVTYRAKSIEGVSTTTTGFIGPTRYGPVDLEPDVVTSLVEFERTYGDRQRLAFYADSDDTAAQPLPLMHNFMWHAVRAFFENGGKRLYVQRAFRFLKTDESGRPRSGETDGLANDGRAFNRIPETLADASPSTDETAVLSVYARFPGAAGGQRVQISLRLGPSVLSGEPGRPRVNALVDHDVVWIANLGSPPAPVGSPPEVPGPGELAPFGDFHRAEAYLDTTGTRQWRFHGVGAGPPIELSELSVADDPRWSDQVRVVTAAVTVYPADPDGISQVWADLPLDPKHEFAGRRDSLFAKFAEDPDSLEDARNLPIVIEHGSAITTGLDLLDALFTATSTLSPPLDAALEAEDLPEAARSVDLVLSGGNDGCRPTVSEYEGAADPNSTNKTGLKSLEDLEDISIVAAPGSTFDYEQGYARQADSILGALISHAVAMRYRIAVLDCGDKQSISAVRRMRGAFDSKHAAFYYPWVRVLDPVTQTEIALPPSGFVAGIYARNDIERAVYKAPANEVVNLALGDRGFERTLNKAQQEVLNPEGINCFRFFEGRGNRLWGARTISSDPEWKYVNLRRYFAYLERSIDVGTQWAVFEPNGPSLWANVRRTVADFLFNEFMMGAYLGDKPETSYFVKCDRSTMTQNDIDNGRLVCLIGVAVVKPAEFVIFRVGQWTADAKR